MPILRHGKLGGHNPRKEKDRRLIPALVTLLESQRPREVVEQPGGQLLRAEAEQPPHSPKDTSRSSVI